MAFAGTDGVVIARTLDAGLGVDISDRAHFQQSMQGQANYSEILISRTSGNRVINVAAPVKDDAGTILGVMYGQVNFEALVNEFLMDQEASEGNTDGLNYMLVDNLNRIQVIDNKDLLGLPVEEAGFDSVMKSILTVGSKQAGSQTYTSEDGVESLLAYAPIPETGYGLYVSIPMDLVLASAKSVQRDMFLISIAAGVLIVIVSFFVSVTMTKPIKIVTAHVKRVAQGDLTETELNIRSRDEIGQLGTSFREMSDSLRAFIHKVASASEQVAAASEQISASTQEIAGGSSDQANSAQTMNQLFQELSDAIESVAASAEEASELSNQMVRIAREGGVVVQQSIEGMTGVNEHMQHLEKDSNRIGDIIEVIDDIAEQTNLLALNAAIEAARAGEQGRGFAVVADEVRKLAERSGEATKQITDIIKGMQNNMGTSVQSVSQAVEKTSQISEAFDRMLTMINESSTKSNEIAAASEQQSAQTKEVAQFIESIASASEEAAAAAEETAATTQSLANLAEELNKSIGAFKVK